MPKSWSNGCFMINWQIDRYFAKKKVDLKAFRDLDSLLSFLYNELLDHLHDADGEELEEIITVLKAINN